jgi:hypothetical protein
LFPNNVLFWQKSLLLKPVRIKTKMNSKQRTVLIIASILLFVTVLFPPWLYENLQTSAQYSAGYRFIFSPEPEVKSEGEMRKIFSISSDEQRTSFAVYRDWGRRYGQWLTLFFLTIGLLVLLIERKSYFKIIGGGFLLLIGSAFLAFVLFESWFIHV